MNNFVSAMEPPKHRDLKKMLCIVVLFGFTFSFFYIFSLDKFIVKISRLDLEILQNIQIMESVIRSNVTQTHGKKIAIDRSQEMKFESKNDINSTRKEEIGFSTVEPSERQQMKVERQNICSLNKTNLGPVTVDSEPVDTMTLQGRELSFVKPGGQWIPTSCIPRAEVAVIVPFRKRDEHLGIFLRHMHKFLKTQMIRYRIFIVEQDDEHEFNRGKLMNVGFREAMKVHPFNCIVFHDIDLMPEDTRNDYACPHSPRHMSVAIDKFRYLLPYDQIFGGVEMFLTQDYKAINGFSNSFWGWGGEDDNLYFRVMSVIGHLTRPSMKVGRYQMLKHFDMESFRPTDRFAELKQSKNAKYTSTDGLSSLQYKVNKIVVLPLFTLIKADLQKYEDRLFGVEQLFQN